MEAFTVYGTNTTKIRLINYLITEFLPLQRMGAIWKTQNRSPAHDLTAETR